MLTSKKLAAAQGLITAITAQLASAGVDFDIQSLATSEVSPDALKSAILAKYPQSTTTESGVIESIFGDKIDKHDAASAGAYLTELQSDADGSEKVAAELATLTQGLKSAGVKLPEATEDAALTAESVETAIKSRMKVRAAEVLASHGITHTDAPERKVAPDATDPKKGENEPPKRLSHAMASLQKIGGPA